MDIQTIITVLSGVTVAVLSTLGITKTSVKNAIENRKSTPETEKIKQELETLKTEQNRIDSAVSRLELMFLIKMFPEKTEVICETYDEYVKSGKNHYIKMMFEQWKENVQNKGEKQNEKNK